MAVASHGRVDHRRMFQPVGVGRSFDGEREGVVDVNVGFIDDFPNKRLVVSANPHALCYEWRADLLSNQLLNDVFQSYHAQGTLRTSGL